MQFRKSTCYYSTTVSVHVFRWPKKYPIVIQCSRLWEIHTMPKQNKIPPRALWDYLIYFPPLNSFCTFMYCNIWPYVLWQLDFQIQKRIFSMETIWRNTVSIFIHMEGLECWIRSGYFLGHVKIFTNSVLHIRIGSHQKVLPIVKSLGSFFSHSFLICGYIVSLIKPKDWWSEKDIASFLLLYYCCQIHIQGGKLNWIIRI